MPWACAGTISMRFKDAEGHEPAVRSAACVATQEAVQMAAYEGHKMDTHDSSSKLDAADVANSGIYNLASPVPADYSWDPRGRAMGKRFRVANLAIRVLAVAAIVLAVVWLLGAIDGIGVSAVVFVVVAILALAFGLDRAIALAISKRASRLPPEARHDYLLFLYRWQGKKRQRDASQLLVALARIDVLRSRFDLAQDALTLVETRQITRPQLKLYYLLCALTSANVAHPISAEKCGGASKGTFNGGPDDFRGSDTAENSAGGPHGTSPRDWLARYSGVSAPQWQKFPSDDVVTHWFEGISPQVDCYAAGGMNGADLCEYNADSMCDAIAGIVLADVPSPVLIAATSVMVAHCLFYYGLESGVKADAGWSLRIPYATSAGVVAAIFVLVLAGVTVYGIHRRHRREQPKARWAARVRGVVAYIAIVLLGLSLAGSTLLSIVFAYDGSERVLKAGVTESGSDESGLAASTYDYLAVVWYGYDPDGSRTMYYRASDPFLMERWSQAQLYDDANKDLVNGLDDGSDESTDSSDDSSASSESAASSDSLPSTTSSSQGQGLDTQNQMLAVSRYLDDQGIIPKMDALSFGENAKGELYASLGTTSETAASCTSSGGTSSNDLVKVEYRLYGNGTKSNAAGTSCEEYVLQKVYPNGESDTQLVGFYLVDPSTLAVTDEHKTSW